MRCWWCGVEPGAVFEVTQPESPEPEYLANWPRGGNHEHAERAPSPTELEQAGHEALMRARREALA